MVVFFLAFLAIGPRPMAQEMVSVFDGLPGTADSGYVLTPSWLEEISPWLHWSRPAVLADGTVLFVSMVGNLVSNANPFAGVPGEAPASLLEGTNSVWEIVSAGGFHVYARGEESSQVLEYKTSFGDGSGFLISPPELVNEMRHLRMAGDSQPHLVFTGKDVFDFVGAYVLSFDSEGNPGPSQAIPGSGEGATFPDVAADGTSFVFRRADGHILWRTAGDGIDLGPGTEPAISADGSTVCLVDGGTVWVADRVAGTIRPIGDFAPGLASSPALSDTGRFVVFRSTAPLVPGMGRDELAQAQIYLYDTWSRGIHCLTGHADGDSVCPAIDGAGRYLAFSSLAPSLGANGFYQVFRFDRGVDAATNTAPLLAAAPAVYGDVGETIQLPLAVEDMEDDPVEIGILAGPTAEQGTIVDADGNPVAVWSGNLPLRFVPDAGFVGRLSFLFQARDRNGAGASLTTEPVAIEVQVGGGGECLTGEVEPDLHAPWGPFSSDRIGVSGDGRWLLYGVEYEYATTAYRMVLHQPESGRTFPVLDGTFSDLASPGAVLARIARAGAFCTNGAVHWFAFGENGVSEQATAHFQGPSSPSISDDGATVVFEQGGEVFVWRPASGEPVLLGPGTSPALSGDGRVLACVADGNIQVFRGVDGVFSAELVATVAATGTSLRLSAGGRYLLYQDGTTLRLVDLTDGTPVDSIADAKYGELAASGSSVYYVDDDNTAHWRNLLTAEDRELCADARRGFLSGDGRFAVLVSGADIAGGRQGRWDIYRAAVPFEVNQPPIAPDAIYDLIEDLDDGNQDPLDFLVAGGDGDDWDRDLLVTVLEWPLNGSLDIQYGWDGIVIVYTPNENFAGTDTLVYQVTDGAGQSATGTIRIEVEPVDDPPELAEIPDQRLVGGAHFTPIDLDDYITEVDGDDLDILVSGHNELAVTLNGRVLTIAAPSDTWSGSETITVTVVDVTPAQLSAERSFVAANWYWTEVELEVGWNALALPIRPSPGTLAALLERTDRDIHRWDGNRYEAVPPEELVFAPGDGHLLYVPLGNEGWVDILGHFPVGDEMVLPADSLSLVGPMGLGEACELPGGFSPGDVFRYDPARMRLVPLAAGENLRAGRAYWLRNDGPERSVPLLLE